MFTVDRIPFMISQQTSVCLCPEDRADEPCTRLWTMSLQCSISAQLGHRRSEKMLTHRAHTRGPQPLNSSTVVRPIADTSRLMGAS